MKTRVWILLSCAFLLTSTGLVATRAAELNSCDEASLRAALASGGTVNLGCNGTIQLGSPIEIANTVTIDGTGRDVGLSGNNTTRIFQVGPGGSLTLIHLSLLNGRGTNGGAVHNRGTFAATDCTFTNNRAVGQSFSSGEGGALWNGAVATLRECQFLGNTTVGPSIGLPGNGGAICNHGSVVVSNCLFASNLARGGLGGYFTGFALPGGTGQGGALFNDQSALLLQSTFMLNTGAGGSGDSGGNGGWGSGGGVYNSGTLAATNCTWYANATLGGPHGSARLVSISDGGSQGGAFYHAANVATLAYCTFAANTATNGAGALHGLTNGLIRLSHTILSRGSNGPNVSATIEDLGYNLSSDNSAGFTNTGSLNNTDPKLSLLADYGGSLPTIGLRTGSPAIDAGGSTAPLAIDERGYPRPTGSQFDIGAFEGEIRSVGVTMAFNVAQVAIFHPATLELRLTNLNDVPLTALRLTNFLSSGLAVGSGPLLMTDFNGTILAEPGSQQIILANFSLEAGASSVLVIPIATSAVGLATSTVTAVQSDQLGIEALNVTTSVSVSGPPGVQTAPASDAGFNTVTLHGLVNPGGADTRVWFEYSKDGGFGQSTPSQLLAADFSAQPVSAGLTGLESSTDFQYRVAASNEFGITRGQSQSFFTLGDVVVCDEAHLQANVARGGPVHIACDGIITLSSPLVIDADTQINATGQNVTLSGNGATRVFEVKSGGSLALRDLKISGGRSTHGAGILNAGTLLLDHCTLVENHALGTNGLRGRDGASAPPHPPAPPMDGEPGGAGETGGPGAGGALYNAASAQCVITYSTVSNNTVTGGNGGNGGDAGRPNYTGVVFTSGGFGGTGGTALGGAIFNAGQLTISNSCVAYNSASGGTGGVGGRNASPSSSFGGLGGDASGAGIHSNERLTLINVTVSDNAAVGGAGNGNFPAGTLSGGAGVGGGLSLRGPTSATNTTLTANRAHKGPPNTNTSSAILLSGLGGNLIATGATVILKNVLLSHAPSQSNCFGAIIDAGHNLSSDGTCHFTLVSSRSNLDPQLGPLANNGGPTLTRALLPTSPAIDAGDDAGAPSTDQRGRPRPALAHTDIGAYEVQPDFFGLRSLEPIALQQFRLRGFGLPEATYRVLQSDGQSPGVTVATGTVDSQGLFEIEFVTDEPVHGIYRTASP